MKYRPAQYAQALYDVLDGRSATTHGKILKRFGDLLKKNGDSRLLDIVLLRYEKLFLKKRGLKKIDVQSASPLKAAIRKEIERAAGGKVLLTEKVNPELLAGLTILVNDTLYVDASGRTRLTKVFT